MKEIISPHNLHIKALVELKDPRERKNRGLCLVEGLRALQTFLDAGQTLEELLVTKEMLPAVTSWNVDHKTTIITDALIKKISSAVSPSGVIGVFRLPEEPNPEQLTPGLVLAQIQDPGNMGTLIRTAAAVGISSIVIIEGTDPWAPKTISASAGTVAHVTIFQWSWDQLLAYKKSLKIYGLVVTQGKHPRDIDTNKSLLVVGNEAHGLPLTWQNDCDDLVTLPMPGGTESLNAAVAGSIALYLTFVQQ